MVYESIGQSPVSMAGQTYGEIVDLAAEDGSIMLIPVGSIEQHGHHMPVGTDTLLVDAVATGGAEAVADQVPVLVAPPITPGYSPHHMYFGGTLTLAFDHMLAIVEDVAESALDNGFDGVLLLNGHGGNIPLIGAATSTIGTRHSDSTVFGMSYFFLAEPFISELRESEIGGMGHAGEFETSLMLHLRPELVDTDRMSGTAMQDSLELTANDMFDGGPLSVYRSFEWYSESGCIGDPTTASAEKGAEIYDGIVAELAELLGEIHDDLG